MATVFEGARERQGTLRKLLSVLQAVSLEIRFAQMRQPERIIRLGGILLHGLLQQRECLGQAPGQQIGIAER